MDMVGSDEDGDEDLVLVCVVEEVTVLSDDVNKGSEVMAVDGLTLPPVALGTARTGTAVGESPNDEVEGNRGLGLSNILSHSSPTLYVSSVSSNPVALILWSRPEQPGPAGGSGELRHV